tara:strand:- start:3238 stop:3978 length:741 start_codon:yes stop_codon:yes gene_type:complete
MTDQVNSKTFTDSATATTTVVPDLGNQTPVTPQADMNQVFQDSLANIKNENGEQKYKDVHTALAALNASQSYVKTLETENATFKEEAVKAKSMDEVLAQIQSTNNNQQEQTSSPEIDVDKLRGVTLETLKEYEAQKQALGNQKEVVSALTAKFQDADKAAAAFTAKAAELGMPIDLFDRMAQTSPSAILAYFDVKSPGTSKIIEGSVNTDALSQNAQPSQAKKNIMYGASTTDIVNAWRSAGQPKS